MNGADHPATETGESEPGEDWPDPPGVDDGTEADPIEPGRPSAENVAFVLVGVLGALYVIVRIAGLV